MVNKDKKFIINEGRAITNGKFAYGGFPRILKESNSYGSTHIEMFDDIMKGDDNKAKQLIKQIDIARGSGPTVDDVKHSLELHKHLLGTLGTDHPHVRGLSSGLKDIYDTAIEFEERPSGLSQKEREDYAKSVDIMKADEHANTLSWMMDYMDPDYM
jgi:hypothetical protein